MKTFCLITNISGYKYWSYRYNSTKGNGLYAAMVRKYGTIYINNAGAHWADAATQATAERPTETAWN